MLPSWLTAMFHPRPLRALAMNAVQRVYKHHWNAVTVLPKSLQEELLEAWLKCEDKVPVSDDDLEKVESVVARGWKGMQPWCPQVFVYIMMLPNEVPSFADEDNHLIYEYYLWKKLDGSVQNLCQACYISIGKQYRQYSANYWLDQGWSFYKIKDHVRVSGEDILDILWSRASWCDRCICEPLIDDIIDYEDCRLEYNYHLKRRCIRCYDSDSESESDIETYSASLISGNRTDPNMYCLMKENKFFEWYSLFYL